MSHTTDQKPKMEDFKLENLSVAGLTVNIGKTTDTPTASDTSVSGPPLSFSTPNDQSTQIIQPPSFDSLELSPGSLINFQYAHNAIVGDRILQEDFAESRLAIRCIYFLYGKTYASDKTRDERIEAVKQCVDIANRDRLRRVAFGDASDKVFFGNDAFQAYFNVASVCRIFF
jgi:hypothetical protein